ncbi:MAG: TlpA family protein disulfide reductase [Candidatus Hydrogenedentes bacterium]|nr:TlpA family protein disulfide reductase [Candidatus Hydrogenedentota bacterium]
MKTIWKTGMALALVAAMLGMLPAQGEAAADAWGDPKTMVGKPAPEIVLPLAGGGEFKLSELKGKKNVVLDFWGTWCPWCRKSTEQFLKLRDEYAGKDVEFYLVAVLDNEKAVIDYFTKEKITAKALLDTNRKAADPYWVDPVPHAVVIDKEGIVRSVAIGEDKTAPSIRETLEKLYAKSAPEASSSEAKPAE